MMIAGKMYDFNHIQNCRTCWVGLEANNGYYRSGHSESITTCRRRCFNKIKKLHSIGDSTPKVNKNE